MRRLLGEGGESLFGGSRGSGRDGTGRKCERGGQGLEGSGFLCLLYVVMCGNELCWFLAPPFFSALLSTRASNDSLT